MSFLFFFTITLVYSFLRNKSCLRAENRSFLKLILINHEEMRICTGTNYNTKRCRTHGQGQSEIEGGTVVDKELISLRLNNEHITAHSNWRILTNGNQLDSGDGG